MKLKIHTKEERERAIQAIINKYPLQRGWDMQAVIETYEEIMRCRREEADDGN